MKNFFNDSEDSQEDKLTKEVKIQIIIKIVPILFIIVILLITFVVNKNKNQKPDETPQDVVSTEIIVPSSSPSAVQETEADPSPDVAASKATASLKPTPEAAATATPDLEEETLDFSNVKFDTQAQLKEMMSYWEQGNQKALDDLAYLDRFRAMSYQLKGTSSIMPVKRTQMGSQTVQELQFMQTISTIMVHGRMVSAREKAALCIIIFIHLQIPRMFICFTSIPEALRMIFRMEAVPSIMIS